MTPEQEEWVLSFQCSRCAFVGIEKLGTVHVLGREENGEIQVVAFCYDCARAMMSERRPRPSRYGSMPAPTTAPRVKALHDTTKRANKNVQQAVVAEAHRQLKELSSNVTRLRDQITQVTRIMQDRPAKTCRTLPALESAR